MKCRSSVARFIRSCQTPMPSAMNTCASLTRLEDGATVCPEPCRGFVDLPGPARFGDCILGRSPEPNYQEQPSRGENYYHHPLGGTHLRDSLSRLAWCQF